MKRIISLILGLGCLLSLPAQSGEPFVLQGTIVSGRTGEPLKFAKVLLIDPADQQAVAGTTSDASGRFKLETTLSLVDLEISFIGHQAQKQSGIALQQAITELGPIKLTEQSLTLDEVTIAGEKSTTEFRLDKRVFNVGQDLSTAGASALDVLNNVPSVNVSIEGEISLRGSAGVQILIDGKPSVLASEGGNALGTITADMIDKIEVITNPSAKYDAEGTAGILNIVLKKEEKKGINGSISVNTGLPASHSVGVSINRRTQKFNLFSQLGVGYRELPQTYETLNQNFKTGTTISSSGLGYRNETFYNLILGADYHINELTVLTLSGRYAFEGESQPSEGDFVIEQNEERIAAWNRTEETTASNPKYTYELNFKRDFRDHKEHDLVISALGNFFGKDQSSVFQNFANLGDAPFGDQQTRTNFQEANYTFKLDYTQPFLDHYTFETGAQYAITDVSNDFAVNEWIGGDWVLDESLTNIFNYDQRVFGLYGTGAYEANKWGLKLGLRMEHTDLTTFLETTGEENIQRFANLFPSAHTSYKFSEVVSMQAGYSRRVSRPRLWDLNPFFNVRNNFSIRAGNPALQPEFTDSYELTSIFAFEDLSFNAGIFHRYTTDVIERVSIFEDDINIVTPQNIGTNRATGLELNAKYNPLKWLTLNGDMTYFTFNRQGTFEGTVFDFQANQWSGKLNTKLKLPYKLDVELTGQYRSAVQTVQGRQAGMLWLDMGLRKKILKGRGVISASARDIFISRIRETETIQPDFYLYNRSFRGRFLTLGFSYGFGKGEAMEYSGGRRRH